MSNELPAISSGRATGRAMTGLRWPRTVIELIRSHTMRTYRRWHRCLGVTLAVLLTVLLAAAVPSRAETVLKVIPSADIGQLDPDLAANLIGRTYAQMVFDT